MMNCQVSIIRIIKFYDNLPCLSVTGNSRVGLISLAGSGGLYLKLLPKITSEKPESTPSASASSSKKPGTLDTSASGSETTDSVKHLSKLEIFLITYAI